MNVKTMRAVAALIAAALFLSTEASAVPEVSARSAILVDAASGRVLFEKDADQKSLIASTTKIMTGLLVAERGNLERRVMVPAQAVGVEGSSLYLKQGERLTVKELLYGLMLHSGNDAAVALAIVTAGSVEKFVAQMNDKAGDLGLKATHFANPNGLDDDGNYATARDLAALARSAMENETFRQVVSTKSIQIGQRTFNNHNKLLRQYEGAMGVKTGFTKKAGRLLVSAAERSGRRLVAVTVNAPNDWRDHARMLDYGYSLLTERTMCEAGETLAAVAVLGGEAQAVRCETQADLSYPLFEDEEYELRVCVPRFVFAPVCAGQQAGTVQLCIGGKSVAETPLYWAQDVEIAREMEKPSFWQRLFGRN